MTTDTAKRLLARKRIASLIVDDLIEEAAGSNIEVKGGNPVSKLGNEYDLFIDLVVVSDLDADGRTAVEQMIATKFRSTDFNYKIFYATDQSDAQLTELLQGQIRQR